MGYWKRHQKKELQEILTVFHEHGWKILDPPTYYTVRCPCGHHQTHIHLSPSNPRHGRQRLNWAKRRPCWREGDQSR